MRRAAAKRAPAGGRLGTRPTAVTTAPSRAFEKSQLLPLVTDLGALIAVVTALLYYFGWVRTRYQARELGYDASVMDLTITDYVLKSLNVLFLPLTALLIGTVILHAMHRRFVRPQPMSPARCTVALRVARILGWSWVLWLGVAAALLVSPVRGYALPFSLSLGVICAMYARALRRQVTGIDPWPMTTQVVVLVLLAVGAFWVTERVARTMGEAFAAEFVANPRQLSAVTIYSAKDLQIDTPGVDEMALSSPDSQYLFRYTGLRLLERSGDKYFFITAQPGRVIVIRENDNLRMEFTK